MYVLTHIRTCFREVLLAACLLLTTFPSPAQHFRTTLDTMRQRYGQSRQFHIRMDIQAYETATAASSFYKQQVEIFRDGENYLYQMTDQDMLMNEEHLLMVNKATREIVCRPRSKNDERALGASTHVNLDSLLNLSGTPEYLGEQNQLQHYRFHEKKGDIDRVDLYFSKADGMIREITYHYRSEQFARVRFTQFDLQPTLGSGIFDEKRYVVAAKGKYRGTGLFSSYQVHQ